MSISTLVQVVGVWQQQPQSDWLMGLLEEGIKHEILTYECNAPHTDLHFGILCVFWKLKNIFSVSIRRYESNTCMSCFLASKCVQHQPISDVFFGLQQSVWYLLPEIKQLMLKAQSVI